MWSKRAVLVVAGAVLALIVMGSVAWYAALRGGAADTIICLDPRSESERGVYRTYEGDSGCTSGEVCIEQAVRTMADRLRATNCGPDNGD